MNSRRYIGALVILLTLLGVVYQQQVTVPNQEIVLQFTDAEITSEGAQNTLAIVKKQLQNIGVDNIHVIEGDNGRLKIKYYSDTDITSIKNTLSEEREIALDYTLHNQSKDSNESPYKPSISYNLDVFEIQNGNDVNFEVDTNYVLELEPKNDRSFNPNVFMSFEDVDIGEQAEIEKTAYKVHRNIALAIDNGSHNIPEGRAGPIC